MPTSNVDIDSTALQNIKPHITAYWWLLHYMCTELLSKEKGNIVDGSRIKSKDFSCVII